MAGNEQPARNFNPSEHLIQLKSKQGSQDYLPVQFRILWFRTVCPHGTIDTEEVEVDLDRVVESEAFVWNAEKRRSEKVTKQSKGYARFRTVVTDGKGGRATGTGSEAAADFGDFIEKAETKSVGRALAALGYGTQFAPEFSEGSRIVDAPVDSNPSNNGQTDNNSASDTSNSNSNKAETNATEQQLSSLRKLYQFLSKQEPANLEAISYLKAKQLIQQLSAEYKELRASKAS